MQISLLNSQDNGSSISNLIMCVDYIYEMDTQNQAKMRGNNLKVQIFLNSDLS